MAIDDRLRTVMAMPVADERARAARWRQLVDLLSQPDASASPWFESALDLTLRDAPQVSPLTRAAATFASAGRALDPRLAPLLRPDPAAAMPPPTPDEPVLRFAFELNPAGMIDWIGRGPRAALIGLALAQAAAPAAAMIAARQPFDGVMAQWPHGPAGVWRLSATPHFAAEDGRFLGYRGDAVRDDLPATARDDTMLAATDPDQWRELVHELRTPLNAIIGFAEIIDGQYLGPAHHGYRHRARTIIAEGRKLMGAVDDVDVAARARGDAQPAPIGSVDLARMAAALARTMEPTASARAVGFRFIPPTAPMLAAFDGALAERLSRRLAGLLIDASAPGEALTMRLGKAAAGRVTLSLTTPRALLALDRAMLDRGTGDGDAVTAGLRLLAGLTAIAGAAFETPGATIDLSFPAIG